MAMVDALALRDRLLRRGVALTRDGPHVRVSPRWCLSDAELAALAVHQRELAVLLEAGWLGARGWEMARAVAERFDLDGTAACERCGLPAPADGRHDCGRCDEPAKVA